MNWPLWPEGLATLPVTSSATTDLIRVRLDISKARESDFRGHPVSIVIPHDHFAMISVPLFEFSLRFFKEDFNKDEEQSRNRFLASKTLHSHSLGSFNFVFLNYKDYLSLLRGFIKCERRTDETNCRQLLWLMPIFRMALL